MNPDTKIFEPEHENTPAEWPRFAVGEHVLIKGVKFEVRKVTKRDLILRPIGQKAKQNWEPGQGRRRR